MAVFKSLISNDIKNTKSVLNQLVDIVREDVSGSNSRKTYEVFVTSSVGPGVTSSLYQTVFDQDFSLQTANSMFDITFGFSPETDFINSRATGDTNPEIYVAGDSAKKKRYEQTSLMVREKVSIYKQFAATLLGDPNLSFHRTIGSTNTSDRINAAVFLSFHRLFVRDGIKRETFAMRMKYNLACMCNANSSHFTGNLFQAEGTNERIYTDFGATSRRPMEVGGNVGELVRADNVAEKVGLIFYDHGTVVLDATKVFATNDIGYGVIDAMTDTTSQGSAKSVFREDANDPLAQGVIPRGKALFGPNGQSAGGAPEFHVNGAVINGGELERGGAIYPYFFTSGSIDDITDHICNTRFGSDAGTAITFQNKTEINSTIYFIRAAPDEFNYSSNPTYTDGSGRIVVTDVSVNALEKPFSYITTVGLYGDFDDLLAVAKLSRPVEKNDEKDLTIRVRLDF